MLLRRRSFLWLAGCGAAVGLDQTRRTWPSPRTQPLRVLTWNLRNFPGDHDATRMRSTLLQAAPDVVLLQELIDPSAASRLLPGYQIRCSTLGGRGGQHVAIAVAPARLRLIAPPQELTSLTLGGRVRPGLAALLAPADTRFRFWAVCVHLKARPQGYPTRVRQWDLLANELNRLGGPAVIGGDFNCTGPVGGNRGQELDGLTQRLGAAGAKQIPNDAGCSATWGGVRYDAWQEPALLDLFWVKSWGDAAQQSQTSPGGQCKTHGCRAFRSTGPYPDLDLVRASDHCPLVVDLPEPSAAQNAAPEGELRAPRPVQPENDSNGPNRRFSG